MTDLKDERTPPCSAPYQTHTLHSTRLRSTRYMASWCRSPAPHCIGPVQQNWVESLSRHSAQLV